MWRGASSSPQADNPFPKVTDFTEINRTGAYQTASAQALSPVDPKVNVALYNHTDAGLRPTIAWPARSVRASLSANAVSDTLIDWVLKRSKGRADVPTPKQLGVVDTY